MARVEVISGPERRRRWSEEEKRAIVAASLAPGAVMNVPDPIVKTLANPLAQRGPSTHAVADGFAPVLIAPPDARSATAGGDAACGDPAIEVEFAGKVRVRIPGSVPAGLAAAVVKALARR